MSEQNKSLFDEVIKQQNRVLGNAVVEELKKKGFFALYTDTKEEALEEVLKIIPEGATVGIPGSITIREIGVLDKLKEKGHTVFHHWDTSLSSEEKLKMRKEELVSDIFLTSSNALTFDGMLVNIDASGNRVSGMAWGNNKIIFVVGINKITFNIESAIQRIRDKATPPNAIRLKIDTPCSHTGHCLNCDSPKRLCRALLILERATIGRESHVIIVGQKLGY